MKKVLFIFLFIFLIVFSIGCKTTDVDDNNSNNLNNNNNQNEEKDLNTYSHTKLLLLDKEKKYIELLGCEATQLSDDVSVKKIVGEDVVDASIDDLYIGMDNLYVQIYDNKKIDKILIDKDPIFPRIRVAIRKTISNISDINTLYHDSVTLHIPSNTTIETYDKTNSFIVDDNTTVTFNVKDNYIYGYVGKRLIKSSKRLIINETDSEVIFQSISRGVGIPSYEGNIELSVVNGKILVINDVLMENYLEKVVPSEMPSSWNMEALKSQAVAARTYAYKEIYRNNFASLGYVVDDSESSQVYNNQSKQETSSRAVLETKGLTMFCENEPIVAYYFSTCSGLLGAGNEVWIENKVTDKIPYLLGGNISSREVDTTDENDVLNYFKDLSVDSPAANSSNFRWKISMNKKQLQNTLNVNIALMAPNYKSSYLILQDGNFVEGDIPSDIGEIQDVFVSQRGESGVVVSIQIVASNVTFRIYNQYNIRFTIRPKDCGSLVEKYNCKGNSTAYTDKTNNPSILPSGYFALEWEGDILHFYGGGNGHGVGMCQYSANDYAKKGKTFDEILNVFYKNIILKNTSRKYIPMDDFEKYFK
mgnify:CR=1 FL=1